jgi:hypothetical protein
MFELILRNHHVGNRLRFNLLGYHVDITLPNIEGYNIKKLHSRFAGCSKYYMHKYPINITCEVTEQEFIDND